MVIVVEESRAKRGKIVSIDWDLYVKRLFAARRGKMVYAN